MNSTGKLKESLEFLSKAKTALSSILSEQGEAVEEDVAVIQMAVCSIEHTINELRSVESSVTSEPDECYLGEPEESLEEEQYFDGKDSILIVEDDEATRNSLASDLGREYRTFTADNGVKGLNLAREKSPDIIISDIGMPEMDGLEMCQAIKSSTMTSHIPVILLTGKQDKQTIIHGFESGASDYIVKPYDIAVLTARIKNILNDRQRLRDIIITTSVSIPAGLSFSNRLDKEFMNRVLKVLEKEMSNTEFQIEDFCRQLAMSRTAFYNKLKALTGMSPNDFVRMVRLNKAKEILSSKMYNVTEVSEMVGFSDPKYFSICFKKQFDISPSKLNLI